MGRRLEHVGRCSAGELERANADGIGSGSGGAVPALDPLRDPGNDGFFLEGERVDIPVGLNLYLPEGTRLGGHRLSIEAILPAHHDYTGPQLGLDWGLVVGYQVSF